MKPTLLIIFSAVLVVPAGCGRRANQGTAQAPSGETLIFQPLPTLRLAQGEEKQFSVGLAREKVKGPVTLTISSPPEGASIVEKDTTIKDGENSIILTMKVAEDAPPCSEVPITIKATLGTLETTAQMRLTITPSLK